MRLFAFLISVLLVLSVVIRADVIPNLEQEKECHVATVTFYENPVYHYERLRHLYAGCTHVSGNLVIADLSSAVINYDLSFLESIRYVSGYVAIYTNVYPAVVSLPRLEIIRGNHTFSDSPVRGVPRITLLIAVNNHRQIYMPRLKEISTGNALIDLQTSKRLCYLDSIDWGSIVRDGIAHVSTNNATCPGCSRACQQDDKDKHCWGPTDDLCQWPAGPSHCAAECRGRCSWNDSQVCCHPQCAVGCFGPSPRHCMMCKDFRLEDGTCVSHCPYRQGTYPEGQNCISV